MGDIAEAAGLSRPSLYLLFPNKEAIFRASVARTLDRLLAEASAALQSDGSLEQRLSAAFGVWTVDNYRIRLASPEAPEIIAHSNQLAGDLIDLCVNNFLSQLTDALRPHFQGRAEISAELAARHLLCACRGFSDSRPSVEDLQSMVRLQIHLMLKALDLAPPSA